MSELIIKISAEAKDFEDKIDGIKDKTEKLESQLGSLAKISGAAFAGLTAAAGLSVKAFAESEKSSKELEVALKNQGIASSDLVDQYKSLAAEIQRKTGIDDDAIVKGEAILQNFLGQTEVSADLANALANLSEKTGSVDSAAEILGRGIAGNTRGLKQFGIVVDDNLDKNERLAKILEQVDQKFGNLAKSGNEGLGSFRGLKAATSDFLENVGERLAPAIVTVVQALTGFFQQLNDNKPLLDFIVETGKIVGIVSGVVLGLSTAAIAVVKVQQAFQVAQAAITAFGLASKVAIGATGIGLLAIVVGEIYANWSKIFPALQAIYQSFSGNISKISGGLGQVISGALHLDGSKISSGFSQLKGVVAEGFDAIKKTAPKDGELSLAKAVTSTPAQIAAAKKASDELAQSEQDKKDRIDAENELIRLTREQASQEAIDLQKKEIEILKQVEDDKYKNQREALIDQYNQLIALDDEQVQIDQDRTATFNELKLLQQADFLAKSQDQQNLFIQKNQQALLAQIKTEKQIRDQRLLDEQKALIDNNNKKLADQAKYGVAYATINSAIYSSEVSSFKSAADQLVALSSSKNAALKAIGKAAAVSQIAVDTAKGATAVYANFLAAIPFPPVAIPLGLAAAAAMIAFGVERTSNVLSAADGGIVPGFNRGGDSVSSFLQPGELVVPRSNFDEVVNAVASQRAANETQGTSGVSSGAGGGQVVVDLRFSGDKAEQFLTARQVEARSLGTLAEATA